MERVTNLAVIKPVVDRFIGFDADELGNLRSKLNEENFEKLLNRHKFVGVVYLYFRDNDREPTPRLVIEECVWPGGVRDSNFRATLSNTQQALEKMEDNPQAITLHYNSGRVFFVHGQKLLPTFLKEHFGISKTVNFELYIDREKEFCDLKDVNKPQVLIIEGPCGAGKTWLGARFAQDLVEEGKLVMWESCTEGYSVTQLMNRLRDACNHSADRMPEELVPLSELPSEYLNNDVKSVARLLAGLKVNIVLDDYHQSQQESFIEFLRAYSQYTNKAQIVIITREGPKIRVSEIGKLPHRFIRMSDLNEEQTIEYIRRRWAQNVESYTDEQLKKIYEKVGGYFLLIDYICRKLASAPLQEVLLAPIRDDFSDVFSRIPDNEMNLLKWLSVFRGGIFVPWSAIKYIFKKFGADHLLIESVESLTHRGMIEMVKSDYEYYMPGKIQYLLVAYLENTDFETFQREKKELHKEVAEYYQKGDDSIEMPPNPQNQIEAFYHFVKAGEIEHGVLYLVENEKYIIDSGYMNILAECLRYLPQRFDPSQTDSFLEASEKLIRGNIHYYRGQYQEALEHYQSAFEATEEGKRQQSSNSEKIEALQMPLHEYRGLTWRKVEKFDKAMEDFRKCLDIAQGRGDCIWEAHALSNLGMIYRETGEYEKAIKNITDAVKIREKLLQQIESGQPLPGLSYWAPPLAHVQIGDQDSLLAYCYLELAKVDKASEAVKKAKQHFRAAGAYGEETYYRGRLMCAEAFTQAMQGCINTKEGYRQEGIKCWQKAIGCAKEAYEFPQKQGNMMGAIAGQYCLGVICLKRAKDNLYLGEGQEYYEKAEVNLEECLSKLDVGFNGKMPLKFAKVHKALGDVYKDLNETLLKNKHNEEAEEFAIEAGKDINKIEHISPLV